MTEQNTPQAEEPTNASPQSRSGLPRRILMVEDELLIRRLITKVLIRSGYHVDGAEDGEAAWDTLQLNRYDLLITDNMMPKMSGIELLKKIHATRMALPAIMATETLPTWEFAAHPWLMPAALLFKPYNFDELSGTVEKVLREVDRTATGSQPHLDRSMTENNISHARELARAPLQRQTGPSGRILVVEDEPDIRRLNAEALKNSGYKVDTAEDGMAGWKALHAVSHAPDSYDLLITDHDMPGLTGLALVKKLRAAHMALPVIMATGALPTEDLFTRYPWLQPATVLLKPYSIEELLGTVRKVIHLTDPAREQIAQPNWQTKSSTVGLQL